MSSILETLRKRLEDSYDGTQDGKTISASKVGSEPYQVWMSLHNKADKYQLSQASIGSLCHSGLEVALSELAGTILEKRIIKELDGFNISGKYDLYDYENGVIYDFKTTKKYTINQFEKSSLTHSYTKQLEVYKWLIGKEDLSGAIIWLIKDAVTGEDSFKESRVKLRSLSEIELDLKKLIESVKTKPEPCKDKWVRKVKGKSVPMKCLYYCSYSKSCEAFSPTVEQTIQKW